MAEKPLEVGDQVITPTGREAQVLAVYPLEGEALVYWTNGERARFKFNNLRRASISYPRRTEPEVRHVGGPRYSDE